MKTFIPKTIDEQLKEHRMNPPSPSLLDRVELLERKVDELQEVLKKIYEVVTEEK